MEEWEKEERRQSMENHINMMKDLEQAAALKQQRDYQNWEARTIADEADKCRKEFGLGPDEEMTLMRDYKAHEADVRRGVRKLFERKASRLGARSTPEKKAPSTRSESPRRQSSGKLSMDEARARAQKRQLTDDELCELLPRLI